MKVETAFRRDFEPSPLGYQAPKALTAKDNNRECNVRFANRMRRSSSGVARPDRSQIRRLPGADECIDRVVDFREQRPILKVSTKMIVLARREATVMEKPNHVGRRILLTAAGAAALSVAGLAVSDRARAASGSEIDREVDAALTTLYAQSAEARGLRSSARAVLIFPRILKGGFIVGGQYGEGALRQAGNRRGYYSIASASFGLQIGAQSFGEALFFRTEDSLVYLDRSAGFELGVDLAATAIEAGLSNEYTSTTLTQPVVAIAFSERGLLAGLTVEGSKISKIDR